MIKNLFKIGLLTGLAIMLVAGAGAAYAASGVEQNPAPNNQPWVSPELTATPMAPLENGNAPAAANPAQQGGGQPVNGANSPGQQPAQPGQPNQPGGNNPPAAQNNNPAPSAPQAAQPSQTQLQPAQSEPAANMARLHNQPLHIELQRQVDFQDELEDLLSKYMAEALGLTQSQFEKRLANGETFESLAEDKGYTQAEIESMLQRVRQKVLTKAVAQGWLLQTQADRMEEYGFVEEGWGPQWTAGMGTNPAN